MNKEINLNDIKKFATSFENKKEYLPLQNTVTNNGINQSAYNYKQNSDMQFVFSLDLMKTTKVTNQKKSGRCWMFASTNLMRYEVMKNLNIENMELSQAYPMFYDKLEKANFFLENIIKTKDEETSSRLISFLLTSPVQDGGQWDMFVSLVNKYGAVPKEIMPETYSSSNTMELNKYLTMKLRQYASIIRKKHQEGHNEDELRKLKSKMMETIYRILSISLGNPPLVFNYEYLDKDKNYHIIKNITPKEFYQKYVKLDLSNKISIINAPTKDKPFNRSFTVKYLGNVYDGRQVKYLNLSINDFKSLIIKQLKDNNPVWFGSDVSQFGERNKGFLSRKNYLVDKLFDTDFKMSKEDRLDYGESKMNHAMTILGVNLDGNKPTRWKIENSWGEETGQKGIYVMDDDWFDNFVYQAVIDKKYLSEKQLEEYNQEPIELEPWDPCGSLA